MAYNLLVVDDSRTAQSMLIKTLKLSGLAINDIHTAVNGAEALDCMRNNWIDMVLTDINMPTMTGIELIENMASDDLLQSIPVIVVSTDGSVGRTHQIESSSVKGYVRKPFVPEELAATLRNILEDQSGNEED